MKYTVDFLDANQEKANTTFFCAKVLIREEAAIFVDLTGTVLGVIPLARIVLINLVKDN